MQADLQQKGVAHIVVGLEQAFGLSPDDVARALDVNVRTVERWRKGMATPQREAQARLAALSKLRHRLANTFSTEEAARDWLHCENRYLRGFTPADALRVGRPDRVEGALEIVDAGIFV